MDTSPAVEAARLFLAIVWDGEPPTDQELLFALDRILCAFHRTPASEPLSDLEASREDGAALFTQLAARFPLYGLYPVADPAVLEQPVGYGDAIDDLRDLTLDLRQVVWLADHAGVDDAHWLFRLLHWHWGRHARELALYLHARHFG